MNSKQQKTPAITIFVRVMCIALAVLMVIGIVVMIVQYSSFKISAMSNEEYDNRKIRVGLVYGDDVTASFELKTDYGFQLGAVDSQNNFTSLYSVSNTTVTAASDINLFKQSGQYVASSGTVTIGAYQIRVNAEYANEQDQKNAVSAINQNLQNAGIYSALIYAFAAYENGKRIIKIGDFLSVSGAQAKIAVVEPVIGISCQVSSPSSTSIMLLDPNSDKLVFEFDGGGNAAFGLSAIQTSSGKIDCIKTPANNIYSGIFEFHRHTTSSGRDGVALTNILYIEEYMAGVQPWEISASWNHQLQKAFAIVLRTYTLSHLGRHYSEYGFDLCCTTNCQVYLGRGRTNDNVLTAIDETKAQVLTYSGKLAPVYYAAVFGGNSVSIHQVWGGSTFPYMMAVKTPWENYPKYQHGEWVSEVSPTELCQYLNSKGYSSLQDSIADIHIDTLADNSTYVYQVTVTDIYGHSVTVKKTDSVRGLFSKYVYSANFVISKDGVIDSGPNSGNGTVQIPVISGNGANSYVGDGQTYVLTGNGLSTIKDYSMVPVLGANGQYLYDYKNGSSVSDDIGVVADIQSKIDLSLYNNPATANGNFYFIGKGWGHGAGMSQYGAKDLADAGINYDRIIYAYFSGTNISDYRSLY